MFFVTVAATRSRAITGGRIAQHAGDSQGHPAFEFLISELPSPWAIAARHRPRSPR